jgi:hypothetical protein
MNLSDFYQQHFNLMEISTNDLVLIVTALIVLIYTIYTFKLWQESVRQTFLQNTPIPVLYLRERDGKDYLRLRNLGAKPMINVGIEDWNIYFFDPDRTERYCFKFAVPLPSVVAPNEEITIELQQFFNGREQSVSGISPLINPRYSPFNTSVHLIFSDISNKKYFVKFMFGKGKLRMKSAIKKYSISSRLGLFLRDTTQKIVMPYHRYKILKKNKAK